MIRVRSADVWGLEGQSLLLQPSTAEAVPAVAMAGVSGVVYRVRAIGATTWTTRATDAAWRVDRLLRMGTGVKRLADCGGTFEVNLGFTAAAAFAHAEAYWTARLQPGMWDELWAFTVPPATDMDDAENIMRAELNDLIRGSALPTGVVDIAAMPESNIPANYYDGKHPTAALAALWGAEFRTVAGIA